MSFVSSPVFYFFCVQNDQIVLEDRRTNEHSINIEIKCKYFK